MKTLTECAGKRKKPKYDVQGGEAKYWGTCHNQVTYQDKDGQWKYKPRKFKRSDGSLTVDKTEGWHSRPGQKEKRRNANRGINKRARQILKRQIKDEIE